MIDDAEATYHEIEDYESDEVFDDDKSISDGEYYHQDDLPSYDSDDSEDGDIGTEELEASNLENRELTFIPTKRGNKKLLHEGINLIYIYDF